MTRAEPLTASVVPEAGVIALVPDRWGEQWQPRHQVLSRLGRYFPVVWLNPISDWRDVWSDPASYRVAERAPAPGLQVFGPDWLLPRFYRPAFLGRATERLRLAGARRRLRRQGCRRIVLYLWRPGFARALDAVRHDLCCYHIDDEYTFARDDRPVPPDELDLLRRVDGVFIHSPALLEKKGHINPHTHFVPNGVDYAAHATRVPEPEDLRSIPRPRIGYAGWLKNQLDWPLLETLAERHPEWSFVLVGAVRHPALEPRIAELARRANVHRLGGKSTEELARYPQHFDVCLMPYRCDDYTRYIYPLKLHEYLAGGRPTVGAPIASLEPFRGLVKLAKGPEEWSAAIGRALADADEERRRERQAVAREHDWESLVHRIALHMAEGLAPDLAARVREAAPVVDVAAQEPRA